MDYKKLQNGSDIRGIAMEVPGGNPVNLTDEACMRIGSAFIKWLETKLNKPAGEIRVAIGRDSRLTGEHISRLLADGIINCFAKAVIGGMASTPALFMVCVNELKFDAGIMVTASHLPMERNGMKFFTAEGGLEKADIANILAIAEKGSFPAVSHKNYETCDIMTPYIEGLKRKIFTELNCSEDSKPFSGLHIVVDAGNGAGGFFAKRLLEPLGADISGSRFLEPDGHFPNHQPNPENKEAMQSIIDAVCESKADFGIIFDTDVDRAGAVLPSENGAIPLDRNRLIAIMSAILRRQYGKITVVTDSVTSTGLAEFISALGCRHHRFKRGYRNVINEAKRLMKTGENAIFAMETSGHGALYENYFLDDGAYIIVKLLIELVRAKKNGTELSALIADLKEPAESAEARPAVTSEEPQLYMEKVLSQVEKHFSALDGFTVVQPNYEGVRVNADEAHGDGWFLIRKSLHEPLMPCNLESNSAGGVKKLAAALLESVRDFDKLDTEKLRKLAAAE